MTKVIGLGMSKTGTTTLGTCMEILGFKPRCSFRGDLKNLIWKGKKLDPVSQFPYHYDPDNLGLDARTKHAVLKAAESFNGLVDSPWYLLFRELDQRFSESKFILTLRQDALTRAVSNWWHNVRAGNCSGDPDPGFLENDICAYERHNNAVTRYFESKPGKLLIVNWELGDGWHELCSFLNTDTPRIGFPHENKRSSHT